MILYSITELVLYICLKHIGSFLGSGGEGWGWGVGNKVSMLPIHTHTNP